MDTSAEQLDASFFLDRSFILNMGPKAVEEAQGHAYLLQGNGEDSIKVPALLDGSSIDFLFGLRRFQPRGVDHNASWQRVPSQSSVNRVKAFVGGLNDREKEAVADFYYMIYHSVLKYHHQMSHPCAALYRSFIEDELNVELDEAASALVYFLRPNVNPLISSF